MGMLVDSLILPECVYRPGSFTGLMTLYESNFIKLTRLLGSCAPTPEAALQPAVSAVPSDCDLYLDSVARERYTTTLKLTYWFDETANAPNANAAVVARVADPDLTVRIYHDACLVEAFGGARQHYHHKLRELAAEVVARPHARELDRRWRSNMMLNKWLDYLLDAGHGFESQTAD